jgi:CHAD domain-containing protein
MARLMVPATATDPDRLAAAALAQLVRSTADEYLTAARAAARRASVGNVHALRVCTRRLRAALGLCTGSVPRELLRRARRPLRRPFRRAGRLRDLQVAGQVIARHGQASASAAPALAAIARERRRRAPRLHAALGRSRIARIAGRLAAVTTALDARTRRPAAARGTAARMARQLRGLQADVAVAATAATREPAPELLHQARITLKRLRYSLELAAGVPGCAALPEARSLRTLQRRLGEAADLAMAAGLAPASLARGLERERRRAVADALPLLARWQDGGLS